MTAATCPECGGARLAPHPAADPLRFRHDQRCGLLAEEDGLRIADAENVPPGEWEPRPSTPAERTLLAALDVDTTPATTVVVRESVGTFRRFFLDEHGTVIPLDPDTDQEITA